MSKPWQWWLLLFIAIPILIGAFLYYFVFSQIYSTGLFPQGTTTPASESNAPFVERVTELWLGGVIGPTGEKVCVTNNNKVYINGIQIALPYAQDPQVGAMEIDVNFSDYTHQKLVYVPANGSACGSFALRPNTMLASSTLIYRYPESVPMVLARTSTGKIEAMAVVGTDPGQSTYSIYPLWPDILITFLKVLAGWWILLIAMVESVKISIKARDYFSKTKNPNS